MSDTLKSLMANLQKNVRSDEEIDAIEREQKELTMLSHILEVKDCGIGERFKECTFQNYIVEGEENIKTVKSLKEFTENFEGNNALILGNVGLGKTHLAVAMMKEIQKLPAYVSMRDVCIDLAVSRSFKAIKNTKEVLCTYSRAGILVIDEIGRGADSSDEKLFLSYVLNSRYENNLSTILISNLSWEALKTLIGVDIVDRLSETSKSYTLQGESYRKTIKEQRK